MRRKDREMDKEFAYQIIDKSKFGTLATLNEDGTPYSLPISTARSDDKIYIHSAYQGRKIENIKKNSNVSMSFVGDIKVPKPIVEDEFRKVIEEGSSIGKFVSGKFTTEFESAVIFGTAEIIEDKEEKILALKLISEKYVPNNMPYFDAAIEASLDRTCVIRIDIKDIKGKSKKL